MKTASKKLVESIATILNRHLQTNTEAGKLLSGEQGVTARSLVNDILKEVAEGGELVAAVETSGNILGFVPRYQVEIPSLPPAPTDGPDSPES